MSEPSLIEVDERTDLTVLALGTEGVNALDLERLTALDDALGRAAARGLPIVLRGNGQVFSAGVDLKRMVRDGAPYTARFLPALGAVLERLLRSTVPVVAAVEGHAIAGGVVLALACDRRIGARGRHRLGVPELAVGVPFPALALELVRASVAPGALDLLTYRAALVEPERALELGLLDELCEPEALEEAAADAARQLARLAPITFQLHKRYLRRPLLEAAAAASELDAEVFAAWQGEAVLDAVADYVRRTLEKR